MAVSRTRACFVNSSGGGNERSSRYRSSIVAWSTMAPPRPFDSSEPIAAGVGATQAGDPSGAVDHHRVHRLVVPGLAVSVPQGREGVDDAEDAQAEVQDLVDEPSHRGAAEADRTSDVGV